MNEEIRKFIYKNLVNKGEDITISDDDNIFANGYVNSLFAMMLIDFIEKKYDVSIPPEDIEIDNFNTVNNICNLIMKQK